MAYDIRERNKKDAPGFKGHKVKTTATPDVWLSSADGSIPSSGSPSAYGRNNIYPSLEFVKQMLEKSCMKAKEEHRDRFEVLSKREPWFQGEKRSLPPSAERGRASVGSTATETSPGTSRTPISDPNIEKGDSEVSKGSGPYSSAPENNIYPSLELVKSLYEEKDGNSHRRVIWQKVSLLRGRRRSRRTILFPLRRTVLRSPVPQTLSGRWDTRCRGCPQGSVCRPV